MRQRIRACAGSAVTIAALLYVAVERPGLWLCARLRSAPQLRPQAHEDEAPLTR